MDYLIVSAATAGSPYEKCLARQNYPRFLPLVVPDRGSWEKNTKIKPDAVREGFKHSDLVLWIDADCTIDPPERVPPGDWDVCVMDNVHPLHKIRFSAGFILFRRTSATKYLLRMWDDLNMVKRKDHPALKEAISRCPGLSVGDMTGWLRNRHTVNAFMPERGAYAG